MSKDEIELAIEFLKGNITNYQYCYAVGSKNPQSAVGRIVPVLRFAVQQSLIEIKKNF